MADTPKQLKPVSDKTREYLDRALTRLREEGYSCWGFIFAEAPAKDSFSETGVVLETFNNHDKDPLPLFILKTENALTVIRANPPEGLDLAQAEEMFANAMEGHIKTLPKSTDKPN